MTAPAACETCGNPLNDVAGGRRYCSNACRQRAYRERTSVRVEEHRTDTLPSPLDSFVGRRAELTTLAKLCTEHRLVTLVGPAGAGKTRLAVQLAQRSHKDYPDGMWWVGLASCRDPDRVEHLIAATLGVRPSSQRPLTDSIAAAIANQKMLLLLDNCEHLLESTAVIVTTLLARCPRLRVLATSREALRLAGEQVFAVGELDTPSSGSRVDAAGALRYDAVRLFQDRAQAVDFSFELDAHTVADVVALCHRLDGMPLAIELAARRVSVLSPTEILARLGDRLALLTASPRETDERHRTLRAAIEWSYGLLDPAEQDACRKLAVLGIPFDLDLASAVCGIDDALLLLAGLENKSLLVSERTANGPTMFRQLESIRLFCRELAADDVDTVHDNVVNWMVALIEPETARFDPIPSVIARIERQIGVLDIVVSRTAETGDWSRHALAVAATAWSSSPTKPRGVSTQLLHAALSHPGLPPAYRSLLAEVGAGHYRNRGNWDQVRHYALMSYELEKTLDNPATMARALEKVASADCYFGDLAGGYARYDEALRLMRDLADPLAVGVLLNSLAWTKLQHGEAEAAAPLAAESVELIREYGSFHTLNPMLHTAGAIALARQEFPLALELFKESLTSTLEHPTDQFYDLEGLALALIGTGTDDMCAVSLLTTCRTVRSKFGYHAEPYWEERLAAGVSLVRDRLSADRARTAEAGGRRMTLPQAVDYALTDRPADHLDDGRITERERHIAGLVAEGLTYRQIGQRLGISPHTVARHVTHVRGKLGLRSRAQLAVWAGKHRG